MLRCLIPDFNGALFSHDWKDALWSTFYTAAPPHIPNLIAVKYANCNALRDLLLSSDIVSITSALVARREPERISALHVTVDAPPRRHRDRLACQAHALARRGVGHQDDPRASGA